MKQVLRLAFVLARCYWKLTQPISLGVCAIVLSAEGDKVLLVRHSYRRGWMLPGGGVKRGENALDAIKRELREEIGIICTEEPELLSPPMYGRIDGKHDHKLIFAVRHWNRSQNFHSSIEIEESQFFPLADLPDQTEPSLRIKIEKFRCQQGYTFSW